MTSTLGKIVAGHHRRRVRRLKCRVAALESRVAARDVEIEELSAVIARNRVRVDAEAVAWGSKIVERKNNEAS